ncbi:hypothetical protein GYA27_01545 [candidate division WWE3 bacterium]|uniref:MarR family transcriptional regulator n=1 Tax=candidate division WWE3 bacterium TaxID=2053526 RepID=A0A7X9DK24_UNCKA|nr:hypothetical protein [candidate division WWE3 bacterium]
MKAMDARELPFYVLVSLNNKGPATVNELLNREGLKNNTREQLLAALEEDKRDGYIDRDYSDVWFITQSGKNRLLVERD